MVALVGACAIGAQRYLADEWGERLQEGGEGGLSVESLFNISWADSLVSDAEHVSTSALLAEERV